MDNDESISPRKYEEFQSLDLSFKLADDHAGEIPEPLFESIDDVT